MNVLPKITLRITREYNNVKELELVLISEGLSPSIHPVEEGFALSVSREERKLAETALSLYENENLKQARVEEGSSDISYSLTALCVATALLLFFFVTTVYQPDVLWKQKGSADAERIFFGELWRVVTALTLHSDLGHALSNSIAIALFLSTLAGTLGSGFACALLLLAGAIGNLLTALLHGPMHISIGASTSVFAAVGLLGSLAVTRRKKRGDRGYRVWVPIAASLALLAMLGTGGQRTDLWSHLFGLLIGVILGFSSSIIPPKLLTTGFQWIFGLTTITSIILCWIIAL